MRKLPILFFRIGHKMNRSFVRNCIIFLSSLIICVSALIYVLVSGNETINTVDSWVTHSREIILDSQKLATLVESMVSAQRGYIITGQDSFLETYKKHKNELSTRIARLTEMVVDNPSQQSRINEMRNYFNLFSANLEERAEKYKNLKYVNKNFLDDASTVNDMKENIIAINTALLAEEYQVLNSRIHALQKQKTEYFVTLIVSVIVGALMLFFMNIFLLLAQSKRNSIEENLKDSEERYARAVEGTQDGIFDYNIQTKEIFFSSRFFKMLGYDREAFVGKLEDSTSIIHPDDLPRVLQYLDLYINGKISEYSQTYRMKHKEGRWVWITSRARMMYDEEGLPFRLIGAHTDVSDIKEREAKLEAAQKFAEEASRAKSDFLAHMSHEIRTPLTAISGVAEILEKDNSIFADKEKKLIHALHSSTSILKDIVNDVLDFSKIESGELDLNMEYFALPDLFDAITSMMSVRTTQKKIAFSFEYSSLLDIKFYGDKMRFRQILINLVGNAVKFTTKGEVSVQAYQEDRAGTEFLRIDISDTGPGIAPEHFELIFERFKQADSSVSRKYGGTGLGLPITQKLAALMGGSIMVSSQLGRGSTFSILLPFKAADDSPKELATSQINHDRVHKKDETRALIVEDYDGNILVIGHLLDEMSCKYDVAKNGREGIDLWDLHHDDFILMDVQMPEMDGFTATTYIRKAEGDRGMVRTPIIGMTAHALVGDKDKCIAAGMDSYLPKPLIEQDLKNEIYKYIPKNLRIA
jgi:PAS domain S-box-containing protein